RRTSGRHLAVSRVLAQQRRELRRSRTIGRTSRAAGNIPARRSQEANPTTHGGNMTQSTDAPLREQTARTFGNLIGGRSVPSPKTFESRNSSRLADVVGVFPEATKEQVREACVVAGEAFKSWSKTPAPIRGQLVGSIGKALEREKESLSRLVTREMGKTLKEARGSVQEAIDTCHFFQSEGRRLYGQTVPSEMPNKELTTYRRPLGVVGIV